MAVTEKVLKIKIQGDTSDAQAALNKVNTALTGTGATATNVKSVLDAVTGTFNHEIEIAANRLNTLRNASNTLLSSFGQQPGQPDPTANITQNLQEEAASRRTESASIYRRESDQAVEALNQRLQREQVARRHGANSIQAIELNAAQQEQAIRRRLSEEILAIEQRLRDGVIRNRGAANAARQAALTQASAQLTANRQSLEAAQALERQRVATERAANAQQSFVARVLEGISIYRLFSLVLNTTTQALKAIPKIGIELDATRSSLIATTGGIAGATATLKFLDTEAHRTGISVGALRETFRTFQASTSLAGESLETTVKIFQDINTVSTALHLTTDKTQSVFLALAQIFNKSKVQSEELVKQLGNLLPGAFASFAEANKLVVTRTVDGMGKVIETTTGLFKDIPDLVSQMKKGTVTAHETVENFANFLANRFKNSFDVAADSLNANIGRMQTSFTHLGEAIYGVTAGPMNAFVKGLSGIADVITEDIKTTNYFGTALTFLKDILIVVSTIALAKYLAGLNAVIVTQNTATGAITRTTRAAQLFNTTLNFLKSPAAIIGGIALLGQAYLDVREKIRLTGETIDETYNKFTRQQAAVSKTQKINIQVEDSESVVAAKKLLDDTEKRITELKKVRGSSDIARKLTGLIADNELEVQEGRALKQAFILEKARFDAKAQLQAKDIAQNATVLEESEQAKYDTHLTYLKLQKDADSAAAAAALEFDRQHAKARDSFTKAIKAGEAKDASEAQKIASAEALASKLESDKSRELTIAQAREGFEKKEARATKSSATSLNKDIYADSLRNVKLIQAANEDSLKQVEDSYKTNIISIKDYLDKKKQLLLGSIESERQATQGNLELAIQTGDTSKAEQYADKLQELIQKTQEVQRSSDRERVEAQKEYNDKLLEIKLSSLEASGNEEEANALRVKAKFLELEKFARINNNTLALQQLHISEQYELSKGVLNKLSREESELSSALQAKEARIHLNRQSGIITQRQAQVELNKLRQEYADNEDVIIEKLQKELELNKGNTEISNKILEAKNRRDEVAFAGVGFNKQFTRGPSFVKEFEDTGGQISDDREQSLRKLREANLSNLQEVKDKELAIETDYALASAKNYAGLYGGIASTGAETFLGLTTAAQKMYGEQSKQAKAAFIAYKASKVAEATMGTAKAVVEALGAGPYIGPVLAGIAASLGAVQIASIVSQPLPQAHAGLTNAPQNQTFNISKGERVVAPQQNRDLTKALAEGSLSGKQGNSNQNIRIINAVDPGLFSEYLGSEQGEKVIMNIVKRNNG